MAEYALFLRARFSSKTGNFEENVFQRAPENRFWDRVVVNGNTITAQNEKVNADTRTMELSCRTQNTDRIYFAVRFTPTMQPNKIRFMCGVHQGVRINKSRTASPFRTPDNDPNGEVQCDLESSAFKQIDVNGDIFFAVGPYSLVRESNGEHRECCFYKLTVVASATNNSGVTREFAYDPDMDVETGL